MTVGQFIPKTRISGDKMPYATYLNRPLLVRVNEFVPDFSSQQYPTPGPVIFADVVDLYTGQIFINVLWGAGAIVDNLKDTAGTETAMPVAIVQRNNKGNTRQYFTLAGLEGDLHAAAVQWYNTNWAAVNAERAKREAMVAPAAAPAAPVQQGFAPAQAAAVAQPVQQAPVQGFTQPVQAQPQYAQATPANQFAVPAQPVQQAPAQGFGAPQAAPVQAAPAPQGFAQPVAGGGMFSDTPPAPAAGQGFGAPMGTDPAAAAAALNQLNAGLPQQ